MEQKLIRVVDNNLMEVNEYLRNGWKMIDMKVCSTKIGLGHTYCYILIEKNKE